MNFLNGKIGAIKLKYNRVKRTYKGGKLLDIFQGREKPNDSYYPEEWIASTVLSRYTDKNTKEGLSVVDADSEQTIFLKDLIELFPEKYLGSKHVSKYNKDMGILAKILDPAERLTIQVHPSREIAKKLFDSKFGKTEAWYIIKVRQVNGELPYVLLGFRPGITKEKWVKLFEKQDVDGMINALNKFYVKPGDVFLVEGGVPHAIGPGCFILEVQEPTDYTIRVERTTPAGLVIPEHLLHQGIGFEKMFDVFAHKGYTKSEILDLWYLGNKSLFFLEEGVHSIIDYSDAPYFKVEAIKINSMIYKITKSETFSILLILEGKGILQLENKKYVIQKGDEFFIPQKATNIQILPGSGMSLIILRIYPPN